MPALVTEQLYTTVFAEEKASSFAIPAAMTPILQPIDTLMTHQALDTTSADNADSQSDDITRGRYMTPEAQDALWVCENERRPQPQHPNTAPDPPRDSEGYIIGQ